MLKGSFDIGEREAVLELFVISAGMPSRKLKGQSLKAAKRCIIIDIKII